MSAGVSTFRSLRRTRRSSSDPRRRSAASPGWRAFQSSRRQLAEENRELGSGGGKSPPAMTRGIRLDEVWFGYTDQPVLKGASMEIPADKFVCHRGPIWCGEG